MNLNKKTSKMSSSHNFQYFRSWMDKHPQDPLTGEISEEFAEGLKQFMDFASMQDITLQSGNMYCPCTKCQNCRFISIRLVRGHLCRRGFMAGYKVWYSHGENDSLANYCSTSGNYVPDMLDEPRMEADVPIGTVQMVHDAFRENVGRNVEDGERIGGCNVESIRFHDMLDASKQPLYKGCREGHSSLSAATRLMAIKTDFDVAEDCMDAFADFVKEILPEDNMAPASYYEIQKLVGGLGLSYQIIDVCIDNCMIYWRGDADRLTCRFCRKPRYQETSGRIPIPYKRMWYLPLTERLKRLYQSERTASHMRWHAEHTSNGEIAHPSDAEACKHFQSVYPEFASEPRNVYLGLSTDGFNPFGKHGRQYSLWPVIVTPYNLPPSLCMKREFLFLTILGARSGAS